MNVSSIPMSLLTAFVSPLDVARAAVLRAFGRSGRFLLAQRSARVALYAGFGLITTLAIACFAPLWAFALGPIVLGVPHLVSDVRYLVVKPRLHERTALAISVAAPLAIGTILQSPAIGLSAGLGAIVFSRASMTRRAVMLAAWLGVIALAAQHARVAALVLLHGHNAIAVLVFLVAFSRSRRVGLAIAAFALAIAALLMGGLFDPWILRSSALCSGPRTGADLSLMLDTIAPVADPVLAIRLAILFVFAQGFHYVLWLRVVPEDARERPGIRSFKSSLTALERDLGKGVLLVSVLLAVVLAAKASFGSMEVARALYLRAAGFHGYLEIAFLLLFALEAAHHHREKGGAHV